jgi:type I restriction enzyme S subunit
MKSNYRKLGSFISKIDKRNKDLAVDNLKGLSMTKEFRESTSNIVGTDMSKYKIVEQWQFACDFMSVIRVHAFPVVLNFTVEPVLVSPAYPVFQIRLDRQTLPELYFKPMRLNDE